ncbi:MAG TPA: leucine/isoleucine/valine transporter permease subunit [Actinomycetota bacterium]|nr:leucine/isoleucine/valine transporter permease subunit [Actinomycetota bacterium]
MSRLRATVTAGALAGCVSIFLALVGLTDRFADLYFVGDQASFGRLMLVIAPFTVGAILAKPRVEGGEIRERTAGAAIGIGALAGAVAGLLLGAFAVFVSAFGVERINAVFVNVTPSMLEFITFGQPVVVGALILVAASTVAGAVGLGYRLLPVAVRKPVGSAVITVLVLGFLQRIVPITLDQLDLERNWLYSRSTGGLTWFGAGVVAAGAAGLSIFKQRKGADIRRRLSSRGTDDAGMNPLRAILLLIVFVILLAVPYVTGKVISEVLGTVLVFALLGLGLNIVVGYAGLLDLGYVFFFAVGAYATALLTGATLNTFTGSSPPALSADLNFYLAIPIVMLIAAGAGVLIGAPVLRLRGDYLALVTLGLGEMITVLIASPWLVPVVGGPNGMRGVSDASMFGFGFRDPQHFYYLALAFVLFAMFVSWRLAASRIGRAWTAMREDEQIAEAMGVSTTRFKLLAFAIGGAIGSLGGALFAVKIGSLTPASFNVFVSIQVLGIVILGGLGSLPGVVVGAAVLVGLPGLLREFEEYRLLFYGAALVLVMLLRPEGLIPNIRRSRELHEEDAAQDKWAGELAGDEHAAVGVSPEGESAG